MGPGSADQGGQVKPPELDPRFSGGSRVPYPEQHADGAKVAIAIFIVFAWCIGLTWLLSLAAP